MLSPIVPKIVLVTHDKTTRTSLRPAVPNFQGPMQKKTMPTGGQGGMFKHHQPVSQLRIMFMQRGVILVLASLVFAGWVHAANPTLPIIPTNIFNVTNYGAIGNGTNNNSIWRVAPVSTCKLMLPNKVIGPLKYVPAAAEISTEPPPAATAAPMAFWMLVVPYGTYPGSSSQFIYCDNVKNLEICGGGTIDGQGQAWWEAYTNNSSLSRPLLLQLESCVGLHIHDIIFQNAPYHHCGIRDRSGNITISNPIISAPPTSPNTGGINPESCRNVQIAVNEGTPRFRDFLFNNITARSAIEVGSVTGLREMPVEGIVFSNVRIAAEKGFTCTNARRISFYDVEINPESGPALALHDATEIDAARLQPDAGRRNAAGPNKLPASKLIFSRACYKMDRDDS